MVCSLHHLPFELITFWSLFFPLRLSILSLWTLYSRCHSQAHIVHLLIPDSTVTFFFLLNFESVPAEEPVTSLSGNIYSKAAIYEYLLTKKKELKAQLKVWIIS